MNRRDDKSTTRSTPISVITGFPSKSDPGRRPVGEISDVLEGIIIATVVAAAAAATAVAGMIVVEKYKKEMVAFNAPKNPSNPESEFTC